MTIISMEKIKGNNSISIQGGVLYIDDVFFFILINPRLTVKRFQHIWIVRAMLRTMGIYLNKFVTLPDNVSYN